MLYDHDIIEGNFGNCKIYDLTGYPKTINPEESLKASISGKD
jgi:hypothetical protein